MNDRDINDVIESIESENIKRNFFSIVVDYEYDNLYDIVPKFLQKLNCQIVSIRGSMGNKLPLSLNERLEIRQKVGKTITDNQSDLGIILDHNAENLKLISSTGNVLTTAQYQVLISYLLLERGVEQLYLPLNAPRAIERIADNYDTQVTYTPIRPQVPMKKYFSNQRETVIFYPYKDAIFGLALILEKMARNKINFEQLLNILPEFHINNAQIPCDWQDKGRIMRYLTENSQDNTELIDGIKFNHNKGWALVIPDSEKPIFHIFAEGEDAEVAESLTGFYLEKVKKLIKKE